MEVRKRMFWLFRLLMVFVYLVAGILILFFDVLPLSINPTGKMYFGIIIILYGIFRMYAFSLYLKTNRNSIHQTESNS